MPEILITDLHNVIIDGVNSDDLFAAIRNNPDLREQLEIAALNWSLGSSNAYRSVGDLSAKLVALKAEHESAIADLVADAKRDAEDVAGERVESEARVAALTAKLKANEAEVELIRQNTKTAITTAAQYLQALTETELSEAQAAAVAGLVEIIAFVEAPETARQLAEAEAEAKAAQARVKALKKSL